MMTTSLLQEVSSPTSTSIQPQLPQPLQLPPSHIAATTTTTTTTTVLRPTEAQLRWAQFHQARIARRVQERVRRMYLLPSNMYHITDTIASDFEGLIEEEEDHDANDHLVSDRPNISKGRQVLLRVSQRHYEERRQRILKEGYMDDDRSNNVGNNDGEEKNADSNVDDLLDSIFADDTNPLRTRRRTHRKRRRSTWRWNNTSTNEEEDHTARIQRFEAAYYALLSSLAAWESKKLPPPGNEDTAAYGSTKKWSRPSGGVTVDGRDCSDWKWGIPATAAKSSSSLLQQQQPPMLMDRTASWMIHIPPKVPTMNTTNMTLSTTQFTHDMRRHLQQVARHYLRDHDHEDSNDNAKVADLDGDDDDDDVVSFVECFERHWTNGGMDQPYIDGGADHHHPETKPVALLSNGDIASFVAKYEQQQRGNSTMMSHPSNATAPRMSTLRTSITTADIIRQWGEHSQPTKDGLVQGLVHEIETALTRQSKSSTFISADGKLHKPTFARLIQRYLLSIAKTSTSPTSNNPLILRNLFPKHPYSTLDIPSDECNSITQPQEGDDNTKEERYHNDLVWGDLGNSDHPHVSKFVQTFVDQFEQQEQLLYDTTTDDHDDDNHTILTGDGSLNRTALEHLVYHCMDEASKMSLDEAARDNSLVDAAPLLALETYVDPPPQPLSNEIDVTATPVRSIATTTSDVFDRIRNVSTHMKNFRFGKEESISNVPTNDDYDDDNGNATSSDIPKATHNIVGTVSNKVTELFQSLNMKNTSDEAAYMAFREIQDQKRRSIDPSTNPYHDGDVSSQSSFRVLPRGIRNVVKSFRSTMTAQHRVRNLEQPDNSEHKLEMEGCDDDENDTTLFDDVESGTDFTHDIDDNGGEDHDELELQQSALLQGFNVGISGSMDTDGSTISGNGLHSTNRVGLMAGIMLSPTLLTKRHQQAIRAVESYNWAQVKYLLSANPWLAEMADVNTNQYVLHKVAYYGSGQLGIDHVTGEVISVRNAPAPESLNLDLVNLFPSSVHKLDHDGNLPLHMAALSANLPMIQLLGDKFSSGASVRNEDGMLPLHLVILACASPLVVTIGSDVKPVDVVQAVLKYFPGAIGVPDNEGNLPIHIAASVLRGSDGASIISWLLSETEKQVLGPSFLRFRSRNTQENMYDDTLDTNSEVSLSGSSVHGDESSNCLVIANELGHTPLLLAIYSHAGWEVIDALVRNQTGIYTLDSEDNNALHLLVSEQYKDPTAALKVLSQRPEAATIRNNKGMLPIEIACLQMLPREVILAFVLVDLPINLDTTDATLPKHGFGASWWYLVCECDDYYINIVQDVISLCTFPQIRSLCLLRNGIGDVLLARATPKCKSVLDSVLRIVGRFEFVESSPIFTDTLLGVDVFNALDFGSQLDPIRDGKSVTLHCFMSEHSFLNHTAVLRGIRLNVSLFEEIITFIVDPTDSNRGPLPLDGLNRYFVSVESPKLTLATVVRGMLSNHGCQTDVAVRRRYSGKVYAVLRSIAKALLNLHSQGHVHGNLSVQSCAKFDDKWKLANLLDTKRVGEILPLSAETHAIPPEALQRTKSRGSKGQIVLKHDFVARPSIDIWAFGKVAYEALVGTPLFPEAKDKSDEIDAFMDIMQWSDVNLVELKRELNTIGVIESGIELIVLCLSPNEGARPQIDDLLKHKFWTQC